MKDGTIFVSAQRPLLIVTNLANEKETERALRVSNQVNDKFLKTANQMIIPPSPLVGREKRNATSVMGTSEPKLINTGTSGKEYLGLATPIKKNDDSNSKTEEMNFSKSAADIGSAQIPLSQAL